MDFSERVIPNVSANFLFQEALARYEFALRPIKPGKKVLDMACGTGYGSALLSQSHTVIGIDRDREAIAYAKKQYGREVQFMKGDVERKIELNTEKFDAICAFEIIEHLENPMTFLKNAHSLLHPKGIMILSTPNVETPTSEHGTKSKYHVKEYTKEEFEKMLKKVFQRVELFGQVKDKKAKEAFSKFIESQHTRQSLVDSDFLQLRRLIPRSVKEKLWKYMGSPFGRAAQETLSTKNFPIKKSNLSKAEYFVALCTK